MSRFDSVAVAALGLVLIGVVYLGAKQGESSVDPRDPRVLRDPHGLGLEAGRAARSGIDPLRPPGLPDGVVIDPKTGFLSGVGLDVREGERALSWDKLSPLNEITKLGQIPLDVARLDGQAVVMAGFLMPLYKLRDIDEFAFVGSHFTCCFERPPGLGDQIIVKLSPKAARMTLTIKPIYVRGRLVLEPTHLLSSGKGPLLSVFEIQGAEAGTLK